MHPIYHLSITHKDARPDLVGPPGAYQRKPRRQGSRYHGLWLAVLLLAGLVGAQRVAAIAVCGNDVCEATAIPPENSQSCPQDCGGSLPGEEEPEDGDTQSAPITSTIVLDDPGKLRVVAGSACAEKTDPTEEDAAIAIDGSLEIPADLANGAATVFLNGWQFRYLEKDHHVTGVKAALADIDLDGTTLRWVAYGLFTDKNLDDPYEFCYHYVALAWSRTWIAAVADHEGSGVRVENDDDDGSTTALTTLTTSLPNPASTGAMAILPRGFFFDWLRQSRAFPTACFNCLVDHHLLQIAYAKDPSVPDLGASVEDMASVSWVSSGIFKDNEARRDYGFSEWVSALGGSDVGISESPFVISPQEDTGPFTGCVSGDEIFTEDVVISDVPFDYAVPMLSGWDLAYGCDDEHVLKLGIWVHDIHYDKAPDAPTGTLSYSVSSRLRDNDLLPFHLTHHNVSILGLQAGGPYPTHPLSSISVRPLLSVPSDAGPVLAAPR
jgi:hypothetical protein